MADYTNKNAAAVLAQVNAHIQELEDAWKQDSWTFDRTRMSQRGYEGKKVFKMDAVFGELSIFDWWNETLSMSQLKQMKKFLEQAIKLGFTGYVCFKVGAAGCANGMWAHKEESTTGYSPDGDALYHSFVNDENYWDVRIGNEWVSKKYDEAGQGWRLTLKQVKAELA